MTLNSIPFIPLSAITSCDVIVLRQSQTHLFRTEFAKLRQLSITTAGHCCVSSTIAALPLLLLPPLRSHCRQRPHPFLRNRNNSIHHGQHTIRIRFGSLGHRRNHSVGVFIIGICPPSRCEDTKTTCSIVSEPVNHQ